MTDDILALAPYSADPNHVMHAPQPGVDRMIPVDFGGGIEYRPESQLERRVTETENDNELVVAVEYRLPGTDTLVHRSAHVHLKNAMVFGDGVAAELG